MPSRGPNLLRFTYLDYQMTIQSSEEAEDEFISYLNRQPSAFPPKPLLEKEGGLRHMSTLINPQHQAIGGNKFHTRVISLMRLLVF